MEWYHHYLCHPDADQLYNIIYRVAYWKGMAAEITKYCLQCDVCQTFKSRKRKYGHLLTSEERRNISTMADSPYQPHRSLFSHCKNNTNRRFVNQERVLIVMYDH